MADLIRLLPESIANQIAAGEVVQRPASVVKELMENSLDAGATDITLIFRDGGQTSIQVIDNGKGMGELDARMCWERHATSKIKDANDLYHLTTFGFRGEALASIASVSQVEMKTRIEEENLGTRILIEAGEVKKQEPVNLLKGTSITVKNLFYNIPVRRNFLKSVSVETRYIIEEFTRCALSRPDVAMTLFNGKQDIYSLKPTNLEQRIHDVLSRNKVGQLLRADEDTEIVSISGFVGSPEKARKTRGDQYFFINGRYIREPYFHHAVINAFEGLIEKEYHPFYVLFLDVEPEKIDVNVHPTKTEVKFEDGRAMYAMIKSVVKKAIGEYHASPVIEPINRMFTGNSDTISDPIRHIQPPKINSDKHFNPFQDKHIKTRQTTDWEKLYEPFRDDKPEDTSAINPAPQQVISTDDGGRIGEVFQLLNRYIVAEVQGQLYIVHQQLAHERVLYENYKAQLSHGSVPSQQLLFPRTMEFSESDNQIMMQIRDELKQLGFEIDDFGRNTIIVNGTPADIKKGDEKEMLEGVIENFKANDSSLKMDKRENLIRSLARNARLSPSTQLSNDEMRALMTDLFGCDHPGLSPDGRPVIATFADDQIERFFTK